MLVKVPAAQVSSDEPSRAPSHQRARALIREAGECARREPALHKMEGHVHKWQRQLTHYTHPPTQVALWYIYIYYGGNN